MKVAVTGATGFIGQHILRELSTRDGVQVVAAGRSGLPSEFRGNFKEVTLDIHREPYGAFELLGSPDVLIHLAWAGLPNYKSLHHFEHELPIQYSFLRGLVKYGLKSIVATGTCFEYGMQSGELREDMVVVPTNPYGFAKDALRKQLEFFKAEKPFNLTWARLFYMYGEGQSEKSIYSQLKAAAERGDKVFNMSDGEQIRDFQPVTKIAQDLVSLALNSRDAGVVNVCSGVPIRVRQLVETWMDANGWQIELNLGHYPYPDYEPMEFWGSRQKLDSLL